MTVDIIIHQSGMETGVTEDATIDVVGVYSNNKKALQSFQYYLDALEEGWRQANTPLIFNRFSEPMQNIIAYASCPGHSVWIIREEIQD